MKIILYAHQKFDIGVKHHHDNLVRFTQNSALYIWGHVSLVRETALQIKHHFYIVCLRDEYNNTNLHVYHYPRSFVMYSITFDFFSFSNNIYTAVLTPLFNFCLVFYFTAVSSGSKESYYVYRMFTKTASRQLQMYRNSALLTFQTL